MTTPWICADATNSDGHYGNDNQKENNFCPSLAMNLYIFYPNYLRFQLDRQTPGAADAFTRRLKQHGARYCLDGQTCGFGFALPRNDLFRETFRQLVQTGLLDEIPFGLGRQLEAGDLSDVKPGIIKFKPAPRPWTTDQPVTIELTNTV